MHSAATGSRQWGAGRGSRGTVRCAHFGAGAAPDTQAPLVSGFRASPPVFAIARVGTPSAARGARGTKFRYTLSEPTRVRVTLQRVLSGRFRTVGRLSRKGAKGANSIGFSGKVGKLALRPGRYRGGRSIGRSQPHALEAEGRETLPDLNAASQARSTTYSET